MRTLGLGLMLTGLLAVEARATPQPLTLCLSSRHENLLTYVAILARDEGYFREEGLDVSIDAYRPSSAYGVTVPEMLSRGDGKCHVGIYSSDDISSAATVKTAFNPLLAYFYGTSYDTKLVVGKKSGIRSVRDLKGKRVRLGQPPTFLAMENILAEDGMTMQDIVPVITPVTEILDDLESGRIAAAVSYLPSMPVLLASGKVDVLRDDIFRHYVMPATPQSFLGINGEYSSANKEVSDKLVRAMERAHAFARQDPSRLVDKFLANYLLVGLIPWQVSPAVIQRSGAFFGDFKIYRADAVIPDPSGKQGKNVAELLVKYDEIMAKERMNIVQRVPPAPGSPILTK